MKSSTPLFAGIFVLFLGMLGCEKEYVNPSPIENILGDYDVTCCGWDQGKRMRIIPINDSMVDIRVLSNYPNNLRTYSRVFKNLIILPKRSPWLVDSIFFYIYDNQHNQVGDISTPKRGVYIDVHTTDSVTNSYQIILATKRKD
jgi:hypothetical protein